MNATEKTPKILTRTRRATLHDAVHRASRERFKDIDQMTRGERVIAFIQEFCRVPEGQKVGQRIVLDPFQKNFILDIYDNPYITHTAILCMARKNSKTTTIACILIAHLCGPESITNSVIASGAMSRDQASIVFTLASKMIMMDERLKLACRIVGSSKTIFGVVRNVEYKALSAEATTAHGKSLILVILDEVGQIQGPTSPFIEALTSSQGAYENPLLIAISTSAASDADMLSIWIDDALRSGDPQIVVHEYKADKDCDLMDEEQWLKANPGLDTIRSREDLRKQLVKAKRIPSLESSARNLLLNQRISLQSIWLAPTPWKECAQPIDLDAFQSGEHPVAIGLDLSARLDLTAAVLSVQDAHKQVHILPFVFTPAQGLKEREDRDRAPYTMWVRQGMLIAVPGRSVDYEWVAEYLKLKCDELGITISYLAFDRWRIEQFKLAADKCGFAAEAEWKEIGQGYKDFSPRVSCFENLMLAQRIRHAAHPLLNMAAANAIVVKDPAENKKLDKSKSTQRIDPLVAALMSVFEITEGLEDQAFDPMSMIG